MRVSNLMIHFHIKVKFYKQILQTFLVVHLFGSFTNTHNTLTILFCALEGQLIEHFSQEKQLDLTVSF